MRWIFVLAVLIGCGDDAAPTSGVDARQDPCAACGAGQLCVASYDGTCALHAACVAQTQACPDNACSAACEAAYCAAPYQCQTRTPCGGEPAGAFTCYGP
ncbi:MAG TPA: hypothetical protein VFP84_23355 [Kofleriaceae bacterium]|nr:hypothetical protein [Kofleriaceae bacterium]